MPIIFVVFTVAAGMMSGLQSGANNTLQKALLAPWWTIAIVSAITLAASLVALPFAHERFPSGHALASVPWYGWIGGLFGLGFVAATVFASPKLGAGAFVAVVVTASTITSLLLDNWGLMASTSTRPAGAASRAACAWSPASPSSPASERRAPHVPPLPFKRYDDA